MVVIFLPGKKVKAPMAHVQFWRDSHASRLIGKCVSNPLHSLFAAAEEAYMRSAEREVARFVGTSDVKFTDDWERRIERFLLHPN
jgi:hypothetical protein